jgi:predicted NBD/HSP70 family sugar kinase
VGTVCQEVVVIIRGLRRNIANLLTTAWRQQTMRVVSTHGALHQLRTANRRHVIETLRSHGSMTRSALARSTGLSRTTISTLLAELIEQGIVAEASADTVRKGAGRPATVVRLDHSVGAAVSIDVGARHVAVAVGDLAHRVLAEHWTALPHGHGGEEGMKRASELAEEMLSKAGVSQGSVIGVAMGLPAPISQPAGLVASQNILPGWAGVNVADEMSARLGMPVFVENDSNLGALAESAWGAGAGFDHLAYIKAATGIGSGLVQDGKLFRGTTGTAGEIGHTTVVADGPICRCGNRGCLELYAGGAALLDALHQSHPQIETLEQVVELAHANHPACARLLADAGRHIGVAIANLINLFNPRRIIVGGELAGAGELLLQPMRVAAERSAVQAAIEAVEIVPGVLGHRAEVLGGLALVLFEPWRFGVSDLVTSVIPEPGLAR